MGLLERDAQLAAATDYLADAREGRGRLVYVAGEAGIGKTSFVRRLLDDAQGGARCASGGCDGSSTPAPLGALVDLLPSLPEHVWPPEATRHEVFTRFVAALREPSERPWLIVIEDIHWADEATIDLIRHLARRVHDCRALVLVTFRPDEVSSRPGLRALLGDTASATGTRRIELPPLTAAAIAVLATLSDSRIDPHHLHDVTGGNAFFVTEVLAAGIDERVHVPPSVRDAVLGRVARLDESTRQALEVVALAGSEAETDLLDAVLRAGLLRLDEPLAQGLLVLGERSVRFRHELGRRAVAEDVPTGRRLHIHRRLLAALAARGSDPARLAHHADAAGDSDAVLRHAVVAAKAAAELGAHRQAVEQYERALRHADRASGMIAVDHADLLWGLGYERYLIGEIDAAIDAVDDARALWERENDDLRVGDAWRCLSRLNWFMGHTRVAEEQAILAIERLDGTGPSKEMALALSNVTQLRMLATDRAGTEEWGARTLAVADDLPDGVDRDEVRSHALNNLGTIESASGDLAKGVHLLTQSLELARERDLHEHVARAYCNLASPAVVQHRQVEARRWLDEGMDYCTDRDLDSWFLYLAGYLTRLHLDRGEQDEAQALAEDVLERSGDSDVGLIEPLVALTLAVARRDGPQCAPDLAHAETLATGMIEAQRMSPVVAAQAEIHWLNGDPEAARTVAARSWHLVREADCPWHRGAVARWLDPASPEHEDARGGLLAPPMEAEVRGDWRTAAGLWAERGVPFEQGLALARSGTRDELTEAVAIFTGIRAHSAADRARLLLRAGGWPAPRRGRVTTRAHPQGLTPREVEVLELVRAGLSDAAIAQRLVISRRTAEHHVSSILAKTGESSRGELAKMGDASPSDG